ncbi:hypothetical protein VIDI103191_17620 [Vibrio diazotrophicus]
MKELAALIVDDNPIQLSVMERQLTKFGITNLMACNSGQEALRAVSEHQFDIIFSDIMMPEMDGISLIRHLDNLGYQGALAITSSVESSIVSSLTYMSKKLGFSNVYELKKPVLDSVLEEMFQKEAIIKKTAIKQKLKSVDMEELVNALQQGQFKNYYQPQLDYTTGKIVGLEALARWVHPSKGMIFPDIFIPMCMTEEWSITCSKLFSIMCCRIFLKIEFNVVWQSTSRSKILRFQVLPITCWSNALITRLILV